MESVGRIGPRSCVIVALSCALGIASSAACSSSTTTGPAPGNTAPGGACTSPTECGCWQCACEGVSGEPGAAQLCESGKCPTGEDACTPICALANAKLAAATAVDSCEGRP